MAEIHVLGNFTNAVEKGLRKDFVVRDGSGPTEYVVIVGVPQGSMLVIHSGVLILPFTGEITIVRWADDLATLKVYIGLHHGHVKFWQEYTGMTLVDEKMEVT